MSEGRQDIPGGDSGEDSEVNSDGAAERGEVSVASKPSGGKNHFKLAAIISLIGAAAAYSIGPCQKEGDKTQSDDTATTTAADAGNGKELGDTDFQYPTLKSAVETAKRMPTALVDEHADEFGVPVGLNIPPDEFKVLAKRLADFAIEKVGSFVQVKIRDNTMEQKDIFTEYIKLLHAEMMKNSAMAEYFADVDIAKSREDFYKAVTKIKKILLAGGLYINADEHAVRYKGGLGVKNALEVYQIAKTSTVTVSDGKVTAKIPIVTTGQSIIYDVDDTSIARFDKEAGLAIFRKQQAGKNVAGRVHEMKQQGIIRDDNAALDAFWIEYDRDTKIHEATHGFIAKKYPEYGGYTKYDLAFNVQMDVPLPGGGGQVAKIGGEYSPVNFTELCAVGNELFHSNAKIPYSFFSYLGAGSNPDEIGYEIVGALLPLYTLDAMPECQEKREIIGKLRSNMPLGTLDFIKAAEKHLSNDDIRKIGARLFNIGRQLFEDAEAGRLNKIRR